MEPISLIALVIVGLLLVYIAIKISKKPTTEETLSNKESIELLNERERLKTIISNFETQVKEKQQEISSLNSKINDFNEQNKELSNEVVKLIESNKVANNDLLKKDSEIIELKQNLESSNSTNAKKDKEITELKGQNSVLIEKLDNANNLNNKSQNELEKLKEDYKEQNKKHSETLALLEAEKEKSQNIQQSFTEYKLSLENLNKQNEAHIQNITNKILEEKTKKFTEQNSKEIELLVSPLKEQINDFKKKVEEGNIKQVELHTELKSQIENVIKQTNSISEDAINLTKALKGENKRAGNWGEHVLETILENSGLIKGQHYESQQSVKTEDNQRLIPDFIVHLPSANSEEVNNIVIDSKLSLVAYERYFNSQTEEEKETNLQDHIKSVKNHIDELANKKYENVVNGSIGFVMMFIPIEPAYLLAVQSDNSLWEYAYNKKIVLISASNMITSLRLIADIWKINTRNKEAEAMADTCGAIYDKILGFLDTFENVGNAVKKAQDEYEKAKGQLTTGNGNVVKRLKELGQKGIKSKTKKSLPTSFESYDE
jgi:DNA recombination protein RmuC